MKIGIFGGTFSPIHNGHIRAAHAFLEKMKLDRLYVIPDRIPPHKVISSSDDPYLRLEMVKLAFENENNVIVSDTELRRKGKSYTVDTLPEFAEMGELFLLCGTDMFLTFDEWHRFEDIFRLCTVVFSPRAPIDGELRKAIDEKKQLYSDVYGAKIEELDIEPYRISSTEICAMIKKGEEYSKFVPKKVYDFIEEKGLYR